VQQTCNYAGGLAAHAHRLHLGASCPPRSCSPRLTRSGSGGRAARQPAPGCAWAWACTVCTLPPLVPACERQRQRQRRRLRGAAAAPNVRGTAAQPHAPVPPPALLPKRRGRAQQLAVTSSLNHRQVNAALGPNQPCTGGCHTAIWGQRKATRSHRTASPSRSSRSSDAAKHPRRP